VEEEEEGKMKKKTKKKKRKFVKINVKLFRAHGMIDTMLSLV